MDIKLMDLYLTEMSNSDLRKVAKGKKIDKIIDAYTDASDDQKKMIMDLVDDKTKKELQKMVDGGLL